MIIEALGHRSQEQMQGPAWQQSSERSLSATKPMRSLLSSKHRRTFRSHAQRKTSTFIHLQRSAGRPSSGGRLTTGCPRVQQRLHASLRLWSKWATPALPRNGQASGKRSRAPSGGSTSRFQKCGLTLRSSGPPPAWPREPLWFIIRLAGPHRWRPLSSNVRPHEPVSLTSESPTRRIGRRR